MLVTAGYPEKNVYHISGVTSCIGSLVSGMLDNMPFIVAPSTSGTILVSVFMRRRGMNFHQGNQVIVMLGLFSIIIGVRPISRLFARLVPTCIQTSISVGVGLLCALAGSLEAGLVAQGRYTIIQSGSATPSTSLFLSLVVIATHLSLLYLIVLLLV